jgi:hypothetical protein
MNLDGIPSLLDKGIKIIIYTKDVDNGRRMLGSHPGIKYVYADRSARH